jgi:hypothetical protein
MWNVKAKVIPAIIGTTGRISKSLRQYLRNKPGKHEIKELQKKSHIVHCTHTTESSNVKYKTYFTGEITLHVAKIVNTLHKGDNRDSNDNNDNIHNRNNNHHPRPALYILMQKAAILKTCCRVRSFWQDCE